MEPLYTPTESLRMHSSGVLIVHPHADRFRLPDMANGKLNMRHFSLDSPSMTSPPGYEPLIDQKPPLGITHLQHTMATSMPMCSSPQFSSFNPHLVMAQTAPPGLLHISKLTELYVVARCKLAALTSIVILLAGASTSCWLSYIQN